METMLAFKAGGGQGPKDDARDRRRSVFKRLLARQFVRMDDDKGLLAYDALEVGRTDSGIASATSESRSCLHLPSSRRSLNTATSIGESERSGRHAYQMQSINMYSPDLLDQETSASKSQEVSFTSESGSTSGSFDGYDSSPISQRSKRCESPSGTSQPDMPKREPILFRPQMSHHVELFMQLPGPKLMKRSKSQLSESSTCPSDSATWGPHKNSAAIDWMQLENHRQGHLKGPPAPQRLCNDQRCVSDSPRRDVGRLERESPESSRTVLSFRSLKDNRQPNSESSSSHNTRAESRSGTSSASEGWLDQKGSVEDPPSDRQRQVVDAPPIYQDYTTKSPVYKVADAPPIYQDYTTKSPVLSTVGSRSPRSLASSSRSRQDPETRTRLREASPGPLPPAQRQRDPPGNCPRAARVEAKEFDSGREVAKTRDRNTENSDCTQRLPVKNGQENSNHDGFLIETNRVPTSRSEADPVVHEPRHQRRHFSNSNNDSDDNINKGSRLEQTTTRPSRRSFSSATKGLQVLAKGNNNDKPREPREPRQPQHHIREVAGRRRKTRGVPNYITIVHFDDTMEDPSKKAY